MHALLEIAGLIVVTAVTPGPNNIAVLQIAGEQGLRSAYTAILRLLLIVSAVSVVVHV